MPEGTATGFLQCGVVEEAEVPRAVAASRAVAAGCGWEVTDAVVLNDSNRLAVHLRPCGVLARVAPHARRDGAAFEVEVARRLAETGAPLAMLDPRAEPRVYDRDGFAVTMWTYHEPVPPPDVAPDEYAPALTRLHAAMRQVGLAEGWLPHFTDRVEEAQRLVDDPTNNPEIGGDDRELLAATLRTVTAAIVDRGAPEQMLHGEPHPGNVLRTRDGLLFVDLETCCRGPVEFDIAHAAVAASGPPIEVAARYPAPTSRSSASAGSSSWPWSPPGAASPATTCRTAGRGPSTGSASSATPSVMSQGDHDRHDA
jgi:hypothetical protein